MTVFVSQLLAVVADGEEDIGLEEIIEEKVCRITTLAMHHHRLRLREDLCNFLYSA